MQTPTTTCRFRFTLLTTTISILISLTLIAALPAGNTLNDGKDLLHECHTENNSQKESGAGLPNTNQQEDKPQSNEEIDENPPNKITLRCPNMLLPIDMIGIACLLQNKKKHHF